MSSKSFAPALAALAFAMVAFAVTGEPEAGAQEPIVPGEFQAEITNPYFPLSKLGPKVIEGQDTNEDGETVATRLESTVHDRTEVVAGVTVTVLEERAYEDGELIEVALDYFAQHENGDVYYFGEHVDNYEDGKVANHNGQWLSGEGENRPGIFMPANPEAGQTLQVEYAPGIAEDMTTILSVTETVETPVGTYENCIKTRDFTPLEPGLEEFKWYCPGVGHGEGGGRRLRNPRSPRSARHPARSSRRPPAAADCASYRKRPRTRLACAPRPLRLRSCGSRGSCGRTAARSRTRPRPCRRAGS